jgi:hypothetical protein
MPAILTMLFTHLLISASVAATGNIADGVSHLISAYQHLRGR